jgi:DNA polymerase I-like protein with 3'-5' exonuclease and polymerase domains
VTSTHRWSSNQDAFGRGGNAQNITEAHRYIFEADPGYEIVYADLKQAESNVIAHVAGDQEYINAHLIGDTHTYVCRLVWSEGINGQHWTGDIGQDKKIATSARPPWDDKEGHDYRFQSKAVQHGSNLGLTAFGLAIQKRIPVEVARDSQRRYFEAFPGIRQYQQMIRQLVQDQQPIVTPFGMKFLLFGRPWDEHTYKAGLAVIPQATVGHIISIGLYRIWRQLPEVQLLAQVHDAILMQIPKGRYDLIYQVLQLMTVPVPVVGVDGVTRTTVIETEASVGKNWGHANDKPEKGRLNTQGVREIIFKSETEWSIK